MFISYLFIMKTLPIVITYFYYIFYILLCLLGLAMIYIFYIYCRNTRMSPELFYHLLELVGPYIAKKSCRSRNGIPKAERLLLTLIYLTAGVLQQSLSFSFRIWKSAVSNIVQEFLWSYMKGVEKRLFESILIYKQLSWNC